MRSTSSENSIYIPEEILINILLRLPVKSLVRFMCVFKSWNDLIGSSSFIGRHVSYVKNLNHAFLVGLRCTEGKPKIRRSIFFNETFKARCLDMGGLRLRGSSNGLLCLSSNSPDLNSPVIICNPSIMKYVRLPVTNLSCPPKFEYRCVLAFGFNPGLNDYKVVRLVTTYLQHYIEMEVYSLSTHSWKSIGVLPPWIISMNWSSGHAVSNGVAYWIMQAKKDFSFHLVSFDTGSEVFEKVLLPEAIWDNTLQYYGFNHIHAYKESVCLLLQSGRDDHIDIWVLQEKCLHKLHTVWFPGTSPVPLGFKTNDELLLEYRKNDRRYLAIFNLQTKQINETRVRLPGHCYLDNHADTYVASLLLLKDIRAQELRGISIVFPLCRGRN
ncbi:putative F-box protein At1g32420 [Prunus avium]|uniref:F-box protein At1g32420 n=1 Tax=Prunus avium TaxID=42229 RepID=A0A6P5TWY5_PRUAV|nr:putative F-box protein At1g32420 [Prunus avium]